MTAFMPSDEENYEAYEFSEEDKKVLIAMDAYDEARAKALGAEMDTRVLWCIIVAADALREALGMTS